MYQPPLQPGKVLGASTVAAAVAILPQTSSNPIFDWIKTTNIALFIIALLIVWGAAYLAMQKLFKSALWLKVSKAK